MKRIILLLVLVLEGLGGILGGIWAALPLIHEGGK